MHARTSLLVFVFLIVIVGLADQFVPERIEKYPIPFKGMVMDNGKIWEGYTINLVDWVYHFAVHVQWILVAVIFLMEFKFKVFFWSFLGIQVADLIDFIYTFNTDWFYYFGRPFTMNVLAGLIILIAIMIEAWKLRRSYGSLG